MGRYLFNKYVGTLVRGYADIRAVVLLFPESNSFVRSIIAKQRSRHCSLDLSCT